MLAYRIADVVINAEFRYDYSVKLLKDYAYCGENKPDLVAVTTDEDIEFERRHGGQTFPDYYLESLALFRKLSNYVLTSGKGFIFHCSALAVDGEAYLFAAPSGTGKSTHAALWRKMLGDDRVTVINDDKPIVIEKADGFYAFGTPWTGKHRLGNNCSFKVKAVCNINRGTENRIEKVSVGEMAPIFFNQTLRPENPAEMQKLIAMANRFLESADLYKLYCNVSPEAAKLSFHTMKGE